MPTYTLAALERAVWDQLDGNTVEFTEPYIRAIINQGLYRLNTLVGFLQATVPIPNFSVANQLLYARPAGILIPLRVDFEGQELEKTSLLSLSRRFRDFATDTGQPARWCRVGLKTILIHPADSVGGGLIEVSGVAPVTALVNQGDVVNLEDQFVEILALWAKGRALLKEGGKAFADASLGYQTMISVAKQYMLWKDLAFPQYWILKADSTGDGKGTGVA